MVLKTASRLLLIVLLVLVSRTTSADAVNPLKKFLNGGMTKSLDDSASPGSGGNTCDNALAKSLVMANDEKELVEKERDEARKNHAMALDNVAQLSSELASTKETLSKRIHDLEHSEARLRQASALQRAASEKELETAILEAEKKVRSMQTMFDDTMEKSEKLWTTKMEKKESALSDLVAALKAESETTLGRVKDELEEKIATLEGALETVEKEHAQQLAAARQEAATTLHEVKRQLTEKYDDKHAEVERIKIQAEEERLKILRTKEEDARSLMDEHSSLKRSLEDQHSRLVLELKQEMESSESKANERLRAREDELASQMKKMQRDAKTQLQDAKASHAKEVENLAKTIETMKSDHSRLEKKMKALQRDYDAATKEIQEWRELHRARSYCNFTHISEDTTAAVTTASKIAAAQLTAAAHVASEKVLVATKTASEQIKVATEVVVHAAEPHIETGRQMYDAHLKEHVDKHILPIHEAHVKPVLKVANKNIAVARKEASNRAQSLYRRTISEFKATCPAFKKQLRDMNVHPSMQSYVREKCSDPKGTVDRVLLALAILFVLVFRGFLWRTFWFWIYLPFQIMWYVSPLPLFFPSRKKAMPDIAVASPTTAGEATATDGPATFDGIKKEKIGPAQ